MRNSGKVPFENMYQNGYEDLREESANDIRDGRVGTNYKTKHTEDNEESVSCKHAVETGAPIDAVPESGCFYDCRKGNAQCSKAECSE